MDETFDRAFQQAAAFQKMWTDAITQMAEVWGRFTPGGPPPETLREMRAGLLKVIAETWDQFMRTPQFMEYMRTSMDGFLDLRKLTADVLTRNHHEMQAPARADIDGVLLAIRHLERRLLDRIEEVEQAVVARDHRNGEPARPAPVAEPVQGAPAKPHAAAKRPERRPPPRSSHK